MKGLLVSESWGDLETSRTSTRGGKEEPKEDGTLRPIFLTGTPV